MNVARVVKDSPVTSGVTPLLGNLSVFSMTKGASLIILTGSLMLIPKSSCVDASAV